MHVHRQRGGGSRRRQSPLAAGDPFKAKPTTAVGRWNEKLQVPGSGELLEVFEEELVPRVVPGSPPPQAFQEGIGQHLFRLHGTAQ
ncbi:hypothetical protein D9M69_707650 [compost metagenome]